MEYRYKGKNKSEFSLIDVNVAAYNSSKENQDCYKIIWVRNDEITLGVDGYRVQLHANSLLFASSLNKLDLEVKNKDIIVYSFNREFYCIRDHDSEVSCNGFLFLGSSQPIMVDLMAEELRSFNLLFEFFVEEFNEMDSIQGEMLLVLLKRLLIKSVRIARKTLAVVDMPKSKLDTIRKFNLLVEMHFREKHKVSDYGELLHITPKSLTNLFLRYYKESPLKVISKRICLEGERLLRFSNKNMTEISYTLGFSEASHFSKFFKKHTAKSPSEYRDSALS